MLNYYSRFSPNKKKKYCVQSPLTQRKIMNGNQRIMNSTFRRGDEQFGNEPNFMIDLLN